MEIELLSPPMQLRPLAAGDMGWMVSRHAAGPRWLGLELRRQRVIDADQAEVEFEFVACSKLGGRAHRLHETSRFAREGGCWFYVDADLG